MIAEQPRWQQLSPTLQHVKHACMLMFHGMHCTTMAASDGWNLHQIKIQAPTCVFALRLNSASKKPRSLVLGLPVACLWGLLVLL
jgi:hypothetical protein